MAAVTILQKAFVDPRFSMLGKIIGIDRLEALARCVLVWSYCTERQSHHLEPSLIDALAEHSGFADAMLLVELALPTKGTQLYVAGTRGRIEWLGRKQRASGLGGEATKRKYAAKPAEIDKPPKQGPSVSVSVSAIALVPNPEETHVAPEVARASVLPEVKQIAELVLAYFSEKTGRHFKTTKGRLLAVKRMLAEGMTEHDIKAIVWSKVCGPERWLGNDKMDQYLCPETLFRPSHAQKYLEQAQREVAEVNPQRAAELGWNALGAAK